MGIEFSRVWAMPSADTFQIKPVGEFVAKYLKSSKRSVDPFARNGTLADVRNDLNPNTAAQYHLDAVAFLKLMEDKGEMFDLGILDPPYSPTQVTRSYSEAGLKVTQKDTQNSALYSNVRNALAPLLSIDAVVLSFGWSTSGMGKKHGFEIVEIMLVNHGGAHNDTICIAEKRLPVRQPRLM
jgi:hypothetical protein